MELETDPANALQVFATAVDLSFAISPVIDDKNAVSQPMVSRPSRSSAMSNSLLHSTTTGPTYSEPNVCVCSCQLCSGIVVSCRKTTALNADQGSSGSDVARTPQK